MLRFSVLKPEAPSVDKKQPQTRPEDKGKRGFSAQFLLYHKLKLTLLTALRFIPVLTYPKITKALICSFSFYSFIYLLRAY